MRATRTAEGRGKRGGSLLKQALEIAQFVQDFLAAHGVQACVDEAGLLTAQLPAKLAEELGAPRRLRVSFLPPQPGEGGKGQDAEFVTFGHPLLDRMLALTRSRGRAASLLVMGALDPGFLEALHACDPFQDIPPARMGQTEPGDAAEDQTSEPGDGRLGSPARRFTRLSFPNATSRTRSARVVYHAQVMFLFKVALLSDEKREFIFPLWIDPVTEEIVRAVDVSRSLDFRLEQDRERHEETYRLERLYRKACSQLEKRLQKPVRVFQEQVDERLAGELRRIEEYYGGLMQEQLEPLRKHFRRMAVASVRADLARTWDTENRYREELLALKSDLADLEARYEKELAALQREKAQRVQEVREKHRTRAEVTLTHAAVVRTPRVEWRLRLTGQGVRREVDVVYDVLRRRLIGWECESCAGPLGERVYLCSCSSLVCAACHRDCAGCGQSHCRSCSPGDCHVCGGPVCPRCETGCPLFPPESEIRSDWAVCRDCRDRWCRPCRSLAFFQVDEVLAAWSGSPG